MHSEALGAEDGQATLRVPVVNEKPVSGWASLTDRSRRSIEYAVRLRTLDSFAFEHVDVIKIDVEGGELDIVRGARATIARWRPLLLVEIEERHLRQPMAHVFDEVAGLGYCGQFIDPFEGTLPLSEFDPKRHQAPGNADRPGALYLNNFIFTPLDRAATVGGGTITSRALRA